MVRFFFSSTSPIGTGPLANSLFTLPFITELTIGYIILFQLNVEIETVLLVVPNNFKPKLLRFMYIVILLVMLK